MHKKDLPPPTSSLTRLRGIGPSRAASLAAKGILSLHDLLYLLPLRYEDRRRTTLIRSAPDSESILVRGTVIEKKESPSFRGRGGRFKAVINDGTGSLELLWFNYHTAQLSKRIQNEIEIWSYGKINRANGLPRMIHPEIATVDGDKAEDFNRIIPVYPSIPGCPPRLLRTVVHQALDILVPELQDPVPAEVVERLDLPSLSEALNALHRPGTNAAVTELNEGRSRAHRRILFDRFFGLMLAVQKRAAQRKRAVAKACSLPDDFLAETLRLLPFELTASQLAVLGEILEEIRRPSPMNRLLQGDVGCGKTIVAAIAARAAGLNGMQTAIMAPTQILASQHRDYFCGLPREFGFDPVLLTGAFSGADRRRLLEKISAGGGNPVIGTHALIQQDLAFKNLGLVIIDEQHRFGVEQRRLLDRKGANPHMLVMSATPIPRTMAMALHADLEISTIGELPAGRKPIVTRMARPEQKKDLYRSLIARLSAGQQAIVVCPLVESCEDSDIKSAENMYSTLRALLEPRFRVGLVHGRLPAASKDEIMEKFRQAEIDLLVGTTVIEMGVHAPRATMIIIEHPERFGLAQLHQLRGRVGRGNIGGICVLVCNEGLADDALERLSLLTHCADGFKIAEYDMKMRGYGELAGLRQTGAGEVDTRDVLREPQLLNAAREAVLGILKKDPLLTASEHAGLRKMLLPGPEPVASEP
jgi:ATP-dependent DNA helicase RecG